MMIASTKTSASDSNVYVAIPPLSQTMSAEVLLMASPGSTRTLDADLTHSPLLPVKPFDPQTPSPVSADCWVESASRASTPLSSVMDVDNLSTEPSSPPSAQASATKPQVVVPPKKMTPAEKEALRVEKQIKAQQKVDEKARKEAMKEEEKRDREAKRLQKEAEKEQKRQEVEAAKEVKRKAKEEKQAVKQAEVAAKENEKKAKEDERAKQARSQLRLNAFFAKRAPATGSASSSRRNSVSSVGGSPLKKELAPVAEEVKREASEYEKAFQPFYIKEYVTLAPSARTRNDEARASFINAQMDACLTNQLTARPSLKRNLEEASHEPFVKRRKLGTRSVSVKALVTQINAETSTVDLTGSEDHTKAAFASLHALPIKYLRYAEDVRPPWIGTYTKQPVSCSARRLCRKPFTRALPSINYDYDSEAEWEEPEEGDNCDTEDDESEMEDEDEDMAYFLDDEDDAPKRRNMMGEMEPLSTNIFWQEPKHQHGAVKVDYGGSTLDLDPFRISPLLVEASTGPIDPFSTIYWKAPESERPSNANLMAPPPRADPSLGTNSRLSTNPGTGLTLKPPPTTVTDDSAATQKAKSAAKPSAKPFPSELLDDFRREIEGSDLSKVGLVEVLKKRFPQVTGKTIQETLPLVAKRDGKNNSDKKWVLV